MKNKIINLITIILFFACILVPVLFANYKNEQVSAIDNKKLIELSEIGTKKSFGEDFESYLSERIGFRDTMLSTYITANDRLFKTLLHPTYTYGKDGYIFFHMSDEELDKKYLKSFAGFIKELQDYCDGKGIHFLYCINPDKTEVYSEYLPNGANLTFPRQRYLLEQLDSNNINYMDNTPLLIDKKNEGVCVFNQKYDAGHWNDTGAYYGINNILENLSDKYPEIPVNKLSDYTIQTMTQEYMPLSKFRIDEPYDIFTRNNPCAVDVTADDTDIVLDESYKDYSHHINSSHPELPKILVFRGSYFLGKEKFMTESFSESVFIHSYHNVFNYDYYIDKFNPDIVLFESVEYATINKYFPKKSLK